MCTHRRLAEGHLHPKFGTVSDGVQAIDENVALVDT